jgi:peptidoglycan/xylan/chitin deacetylase (PgdA/CDA1 family)
MTIRMNRRAVLAGAAALAAAQGAQGASAGCAALAVRALPVGTRGGLEVGLRSYPRTLPLADGEVVLTFDDGPAATTPRVLEALACAGARATFFVIGRNALAQPALMRRIAADGHTLACHTFSHPWTLRERSTAVGEKEILSGFEAISDSLGRKAAPFFRYPGFADTAALNAFLAERDIGIFGCDLWASDWTPMAPATQLALVMGRLRRARRGIVLFHDTQAQTAAMLPGFLAALAQEGFRIAHTTEGSGRTQTLPAPAGWSSDTERMIAIARGRTRV